MKAALNAVLIAQSENTIAVEGIHYFPFQSVNKKV